MRSSNKILADVTFVELINKEYVHIYGINIVNIDNLILASPTKSVIRLLQSIGRGLRTSAKKKTLKVYDIVDDLCYMSYKNHVYRHFEERIKIYKKEKFDYRIMSMPLPTDDK